ncbi:hypothetical protein DHD80_18935 [Gramella sp. AN32]|nr:hypothetical protein [Gramella sp. AN32]
MDCKGNGFNFLKKPKKCDLFNRLFGMKFQRFQDHIYPAKYIKLAIVAVPSSSSRLFTERMRRQNFIFMKLNS